MSKRCVIIMSGGLDSTTILAQIKKENYEIFALTFNYKQRHLYEIELAKKNAKIYGINHKIFNIDLRAFGNSALTDDKIDVPEYDNELPKNITTTYVPARNTIFLSIALGYAETIGAFDIFCGANKSDFDNYPDCRPAFFEAFTRMANLGTTACDNNSKFNVMTPLINLTKPQIIKLGASLNVDYQYTLSCYNPSNGNACGKCLACKTRLKAFHEANLKDPAKYIEQ